ncbi:uncharacterized protein LOC9634945 isoform X2 [Selaginella moellendorffii]|uniref:uncharacterized protein LOC9634945 isoform X2 n=1 Tax=Selaginella moellendorffii TaxID=88036 RepID=UPI000D1C7936|nr:uncharacterized protein LOC9634945 isoform X2 [Selaginella moellendorffii]|eukprot:XP_024526599.1 uncharacterized protein LOC9634945 isoform X2 [Selaginella moellendorffii]
MAGSSGRRARSHPLAGKSGTGPPIAPPEWRWRVGNRVTDTYFYSPDGQCFRSRVQLRAYLESTPGTPSPSQFRWNFERSGLQSEPGGAPAPDKIAATPTSSTATPQRKRHKVNARSTRKRTRSSRGLEMESPTSVPKRQELISVEKILDEGYEATMVINEDEVSPGAFGDGTRDKTPPPDNKTPGPSAFGDGTRDETPPPDNETTQEENLRSPPLVSDMIIPDSVSLATILASTRSHALVQESYVMSKLLEEESRLDDKSANEIKQLQEAIAAKARDGNTFRKHSREALRMFFHVLRGEVAPSSFGVNELVKMCSSWSCRRQRPSCFLEAAHKLVLQCIAEEQDNVTLESFPMDKKTAEIVLLDCGSCKIEACCSGRDFCPGCTCNICYGEVEARKSWNYLRCDACHHLAHLDCALQAIKESDRRSSCVTCLKNSDLVVFWKTMIKEAVATTDRKVLELQLSSAVKVMEKLGSSWYKLAHLRVKELVRDLASHQECPDFHKVLEQVVDSFNDWQRLDDYDDKMIDQGVLMELLAEGSKAGTLIEEEARAMDLQKKAEAEYSEWLSSVRNVENRKQLLAAAEAECEERSSAAHCSKLDSEKASKRVDVLKMLESSQGVSSGSRELLQWNLEQEISILHAICCTLGRSDVTNLNEYLSKLTMVIEEWRAQRDVVEGIMVRSQQLHAIHKIMEMRKLLEGPE